MPHLEKTKGNIINLKRNPKNIILLYVKGKTVDQFTKCCALDLAPKGIRVNAINPGIIRTPIHKSFENVQKSIEYCKELYPIGRIGEVSDTSAAIAFSASDQTASLITGILLPVDGGFIATGPQNVCLTEMNET